MGDNNMKLSFSIVIIFFMLFAPLTFDIFPDENAYAMSRGGKKVKKSKNRAPAISQNSKDEKDEEKGKFGEYVFVNEEGEGQHSRNSGEYIFVEQENTAGVQTPEPATLLLLGGGTVGLIALRRKFKK